MEKHPTLHSPLTTNLKPPDNFQQGVEYSQRVRRAAGDEDIHGHGRGRAVVRFGMVGINAAGNRTCSYGDHDFRRGHGLIGFFQGKPHVFGDRSGNQQPVGVARRSDELDAKAAQDPNRPCLIHLYRPRTRCIRRRSPGEVLATGREVV